VCGLADPRPVSNVPSFEPGLSVTNPWPSPLKLPWNSEDGAWPTAYVLVACAWSLKNPPPTLGKIWTLSAPLLATARSVCVPPSRLPTATATGPASVWTRGPGIIVQLDPLPRLSNTETSLEPVSATSRARRGLWSGEFGSGRSATASPVGTVPTGKPAGPPPGGPNWPLPRPG